MDCPRCKGFMVDEWCGELEVEAFLRRCVNCGAILDPTIARNQGAPSDARRPDFGLLVASSVTSAPPMTFDFLTIDVSTPRERRSSHGLPTVQGIYGG